MKTLEEFYECITSEEREMVDLLREIILSTSPQFREKISYQVPYFFIHSRVCYIWPASVKPGPKAGVVLGFCKGQMIVDEESILEKEGRKEIATITFYSINDIKSRKIKELLYQAILIDEEFSGKKFLR